MRHCVRRCMRRVTSSSLARLASSRALASLQAAAAAAPAPAPAHTCACVVHAVPSMSQRAAPKGNGRCLDRAGPRTKKAHEAFPPLTHAHNSHTGVHMTRAHTLTISRPHTRSRPLQQVHNTLHKQNLKPLLFCTAQYVACSIIAADCTAKIVIFRYNLKRTPALQTATTHPKFQKLKP